MPQTKRKKRSALAGTDESNATEVNISNIRLSLRGWYLRTLNVETSGEFGKLQRTIEFLMTQAEEQLGMVLWDRATELALEEALLYAALRWGPKFKREVQVEIRITDTHLKFSVTVPREAVGAVKKAVISPFVAESRPPAERSLYLVERLMDRLQISPNGRQLVFKRLLRPLPRHLSTRRQVP